MNKSDKKIGLTELDVVFLHNLINKLRIRGIIEVEIFPPDSISIVLTNEKINQILYSVKLDYWSQMYFKKIFRFKKAKEIMLYFWQFQNMLEYFHTNNFATSFYNITQYKKYLDTSEGYCVDFQIANGDSRLIAKKNNNYYIKKLCRTSSVSIF